MKGTKVKEMTGLGAGELETKLDDAYKELFNLRFQRAQGQLTDTNSLKTVRHTIARIKTVMRQRELAAQEKKA
ncbi:MAG: 50S ribosomal protein L29 [Chloroflexi bacterium]|nr:50S ribosomal protein L29 [Chloroflexota bacterium]